MQVLVVFFLLVSACGLALGDNICDSPRIDAAFSDKLYSYFFRGNYVWQVDKNENVTESASTADFWQGGPETPVNAATYDPTTDAVYLFSGDQYWKYLGSTRAKFDGYPKLITEGFYNVPSDLDAAMFWPTNNKFYFMKGDKYVKRLAEFAKSPSDLELTPIDVSYGWPADVDAAFIFLNDVIYIFKGDEYYAYDRVNNHVYKDPYPLKTLEKWFHCDEAIKSA